LLGVLYSNVANNASDMVNDIRAAAGNVSRSCGDRIPYWPAGLDTSISLSMARTPSRREM